TITGADIAPAPTEDRKGKRVVASGSVKDKAEDVVKERKTKKRATFVSDKENVTKKQRIQKKRAPRKFVVHEEDEEETDEE
ncbi:hypothetical protein A2U01_0091961, partial [Trifolium medium]|nr:hypothetical protein [Trifolium medium]